MNYYTSITVNDRNPFKRLLQRARLVQSCRALAPVDHRFTGALLDLGTGDGLLCRRLARMFPRAQVVGYEPVPSLHDFAVTNVADLPNVRIVGDLNEILGRQFDYVFCLEVLEHLPRRETRRLLDQVRVFAHEGSVVVFGVPNELYLAGLCKGLFRAIRRWGSFDALPENIARATFGRPPRRRPLAEIWPGCRYYYHHLGFDYRRLGRLLAREFSVAEVYGSPLPGMAVAMNSEVFFVCQPKPRAARPLQRAA